MPLNSLCVNHFHIDGLLRLPNGRKKEDTDNTHSARKRPIQFSLDTKPMHVIKRSAFFGRMISPASFAFRKHIIICRAKYGKTSLP